MTSAKQVSAQYTQEAKLEAVRKRPAIPSRFPIDLLA